MQDLRTRRLNAGLTQAELARRSGVAQPNIAAYEANRRIPTAATLDKLLTGLRPDLAENVRANAAGIVDILHRYRMSNPRIFGSLASGKANPDSDVDLLVDANDDLDLLDIVDAAAELEQLLQAHVDLVTSRSLSPDHEIMRTAVAL